MHISICCYCLLSIEAKHATNKPNQTHIKHMTHTKTFSTEAHMLQFFKDFKNDFMCCHEVGKAGEYVLKFTLKL